MRVSLEPFWGGKGRDTVLLLRIPNYTGSNEYKNIFFFTIGITVITELKM